MNLQEIHQRGRNIRLHGNGFIQIDLDEQGRERVNVWSTLVPPSQSVPSPIHDHVFAFESTILSGTLLHVEYSVVQSDGDDQERTMRRVYGALPFDMYQGVRRDKQDTRLEKVNDAVWLASIDEVEHLHAGDRYSLEAGWYHATAFVEHAVTHMVRGETELDRPPRVLVPRHVVPDNSFNRYQYPEAHLWGLVDRVFAELVR